jgi:hypothetical protein
MPELPGVNNPATKPKGHVKPDHADMDEETVMSAEAIRAEGSIPIDTASVTVARAEIERRKELYNGQNRLS